MAADIGATFGKLIGAQNAGAAKFEEIIGYKPDLTMATDAKGVAQNLANN